MKNSRGRIGTACNECRRKKIRCDGIRPLCGNCRNKSITCVFPDRFVRASVSDEYVKFLENRTRYLEQAASERVPYNGHIPYQPPSEVGSSSAFSFMCLVEATVSQRRLEGIDASASRRDEIEHSSLSGPEVTQSSIVTPAISHGSSAAEGIINNQAFPSSRDVPSLGTPIAPFDSFTSSDQVSAISKLPNVSAHALPNKVEANSMLENFMEHVYPLYPIIHLPSFFKQYNAMWREGCTDEFYILINLVFTLGTVLIDRQDSFSYFRKVSHQIDNIILKGAIYDTSANSLISLQCLYYCSISLLVHQKVAACCNVLALVSRFASQLYHNNYELRKSEDKELFSRLYYSCTIFDCLVACLFGKPLALTQIPRIPLPSFQDFEVDDALYPTKDLRNTATRDLSFLKHSCVLCDISGRVVQTLYDNGSDYTAEAAMSELEVMKFILEIESDLSEFDKDLSDLLKLIERAAQPSRALFKSAHVLQIRRLSLKILVYRPILLPHVNSPQREITNSSLLASLKSSISRQCIESALELIDLVWKNEDSFVMPSFWYTIFYIYNAAIVVLAALISKEVVDMDLITLETSWDRALTLLQSFVKHSDTAVKCLRSLQDVHAKVMASNDVMLDLFYEGI